MVAKTKTPAAKIAEAITKELNENYTDEAWTEALDEMGSEQLAHLVLTESATWTGDQEWKLDTVIEHVLDLTGEADDGNATYRMLIEVRDAALLADRGD